MRLFNKRMTDEAVFPCPICGKKPYFHVYHVSVGWINCKGYGFHRHKEVCVFTPYAPPSRLYNFLVSRWNALHNEDVSIVMNGVDKVF